MTKNELCKLLCKFDSGTEVVVNLGVEFVRIGHTRPIDAIVYVMKPASDGNEIQIRLGQ